ncbi:DUF397 domain-containing protein [Amycolatopsis sp. H20-H5]|uniref:DUF397 domain-containing protein n=1 Tax=Amycolatopsis sp. H20-H5 TaxID=3046309 RepID=UPI002DB5DBCE|nr:DUF397 domain-containing protein [Amycolatopsis sp. H20-H5]MEC3980123.1 DUF397 domain-containing protein [Amycolatopsis sp. H20-H5]
MTAFERTWVKSSYSKGGEHDDCVEIALAPRITAIRDSKAPAAGHLTLAHPAWSALVTTLRA